MEVFMSSRASIAKHPIHPMLVPFPIALWIFSLVSDVIYALEWGGPVWNDIAFYSMLGGVIGALGAAVPGLIDYLAMTDRTVKKVAMTHMILNLILVVLFVVNLWLRLTLPVDAALPVILSVIGIALLGVSGWLGGELVYVHRVGVAEPTGAQESVSERRRPAGL
jgi:uncharacterized membrane protein